MQKTSVLCAGSGQIGQKITGFLQDIENGLQNWVTEIMTYTVAKRDTTNR